MTTMTESLWLMYRGKPLTRVECDDCSGTQEDPTILYLTSTNTQDDIDNGVGIADRHQELFPEHHISVLVWGLQRLKR